MAQTSHLLTDRTANLYQQSVTSAVRRVSDRIAAVDRPFTGISPAELAAETDAVDLDRPLGDSETALDELGRLYLRDAVYFHHPRYLAHLNCPVAIPAVLGEAVLSAVNSSLDTWDQSAGGTLIERRLIDWTAGRIGFGSAADGVFTSGGTQSNLHALLLARDETCHVAEKEDPSVTRADLLPKLRVLCSPCAHFSVTKAARLLGLADDAVLDVPCDEQRRMRPESLRAALRDCRERGAIPMAVVATAGTTDFGSIDPLQSIARICSQVGVWLHVDAAYGCGLLVSARRRRLLDGIERADSVTVDFHKSFFQPVSSSAVLVRDKATMRHATYYADYLNPEREAADHVPNQVDKSIQTTRRFDALKLWLTLRVMGAEVIGELFDQVIDLTQQAWRLLGLDTRFRVVVEPELSTLVFRYAPEGVPEDALDVANRVARQAILASGTAVIAGTMVRDRQHLKFTVLNPDTTIDDLSEVIELIAAHAQESLRAAGWKLDPEGCSEGQR